MREVYKSLVDRDNDEEFQWNFSKRYVYTLNAFTSLNCKLIIS